MPATSRFRPLPLAGWAALIWGIAAFVTLRGYSGLPGMPGGLADRPAWRWALVALSIAAAAVACWQIRSRPLPALFLLVVPAVVLILAVGEQGLANAPETLLAHFLLAADIVFGYLVVSRPPWTWAVALVPMLTAPPLMALTAGLPMRWTLWVAYMLSPLVVAGLLSFSIRQARGYARRLSEQAAAQAVVAERLRISRELHDHVAHSVGVIALQAGAAARVIGTRPDRARDALEAIETISRDTLAGLRRMLGGLRLPHDEDAAPLRPAPTLADVTHLVSTAASGSGVRVEVHWAGHRRPLPADVELSAYRIIQESLTNVLRHADAGTCDISVSYLPADLKIEVVDDGQGGEGGEGTDGGYGLLGLHERVALLRGTISAGFRAEGGFRVAARLPVDPGGETT
ncbi:signal transduction histidine kinase [Actinoplanes lutulentus]|uniref:histidine kinase n=1 Tax=Actinoplanes lutulentus TaxID=1287878 RepID=A0A327ZC52_9ACTN|nr:histidine kinase [Actinoplanes lutulentus]MBB2946923.1 signal transduction histidine kinase [Actinoplanes lutulentus]RAK30426.1 signal transduction histidine kinase [Actinoplanes lutulentus]